MSVFNFTKEQTEFIKKGTGINIVPNMDITLTDNDIDIIVNYSFDVESEEINAIHQDENADLSPLGYLATGIVNMMN